DPGYAIVGVGVVDYNGNRFHTVNYDAILTDAKTEFNLRLQIIYDRMCQIIDTYKPEYMSIEKLYFNTNSTTAIAVAEARGVILLAAKQRNVKIYEYTPLQVKQAVTGYGKAEKKQVMELTKMLLGLKQMPKPDDTADALALAICHAHSASSPLF
ncbi:MAG: crossover junction endodeoxyribonuclease RuvC, partial [Oscillospiraceae bacterium]|nr:crossover junction endodeoxyribonuclease RuvC [Candidatus Equicaccousia limihippi]